MAEKTLYPSQDCYAKKDAAANPQNGTTIWVRGGTNYYCFPYLEWDFSDIPSGSIINSATMYLKNEKAGDVTTSATYLCNSSWDEATLTYNNQPGTTGSSLGSISFGSTGWRSLSITSTVQNWIDGTTNNGLTIRNSEADNTYSYFPSSEAGSDKPYLLIDYTSPAGGILQWFFTESYKRHDKLWRGNKLILPKDLGFSY